jgi:hypothetical protein
MVRMIPGMNDFDFLIGNWNVTNRMLTKWLEDSDEWIEYPATSVCQQAFEGGGNFEEITFTTRGNRGLTLRLFDLERKEWSLYWSNSQTGVLYPPVHGTFTDGRGEFYGDDTHNDAPVRVRYVWSGTDTDTPRWEQAYSADGGETWETNWIMEFTRA